MKTYTVLILRLEQTADTYMTHIAAASVKEAQEKAIQAVIDEDHVGFEPEDYYLTPEDYAVLCVTEGKHYDIKECP